MSRTEIKPVDHTGIERDHDAGRSRLFRLPEEIRVLSEADAAAYCNLSLVHFRRLSRDQKEPRHVRLTEKRIGYRFKDLLEWIEERVC